MTKLWTVGSCLAVSLWLVSGVAWAQSFEVVAAFATEPLRVNSPLAPTADGSIYGTSFAGGDYGLGTVFRMDATGEVTILHSFDGQNGARPGAGLLRANDGLFYGMTEEGGTWNRGTVFRIDAGGSLETLYAFDEFGQTGTRPRYSLLQADDGLIYGTTTAGGTTTRGTAFRIDPPTNAFEVLHSFVLADGGQPASVLIQHGGDFYGTTNFGVFRMDSSGTVTPLHTFPSINQQTRGALVAGTDGYLYGLTNTTAYRIDANGVLTTIHTFGQENPNPFDGIALRPSGPLVQAPDGFFYGVTTEGGATWGSGGPSGNGLGTLFRMDAAGVVTILYSFDGTIAATPSNGLALAADGALYGLALGIPGFVPPSAFRASTSGAVESLHAFVAINGMNPAAPLVQSADDDNFYGTASAGGTYNRGTVYRMDATGNLEVIHSLGPDEGSTPTAALLQVGEWFYGTTRHGGEFDAGTVFRVSGSGAFETLHSFDGVDGLYPESALILSQDGYVYGTTREGNGAGTVFRMDATGTFELLHTFEHGLQPMGPLLQVGDFFYGTTKFGGEYDGGTIFRIDTAGDLVTLHTFQIDPETSFAAGGYAPNALVYANGLLYGTTEAGGEQEGGTIFQIDIDGLFTVLHSFTDATGTAPLTPLLQGSDGLLYGSTNLGGGLDGELGHGTIFRIGSHGTLSVLHRFSMEQAGTGFFLNGTLVRGTDGFFYGTTYSGGPAGGGIVFRLDLVAETPSGSNVEVQPVDPVTGTAPVNLTFSEVVEPGTTTVTTSTSTPAPPPPSIFNLGSTPIYFDVETTAVFAGSIEVCFNYSNAGLADPDTARLLHYDGTDWVDVTTSNNVSTLVICGSVTSLSPFVVGSLAAPAYEVTPLFDQQKVYKAGSTIPIRIRILENGVNVSSASLPLIATGIRRKTLETNWGAPDDPGQSNPDYNFTYTLVDSEPGYRFNLKTAPTHLGTYELKFTVGGDGQELIVEFQVR